MPSVCLYLHVHQPRRIKNFSVFDIGNNHSYFDDLKNKKYLDRIAKKSYLPTNNILLELIKKNKGKFKVSLSITGVFLDQLEEFSPETLKSFQELVNTGCVEILGETYHHSLASLYSKKEFEDQVKLHDKKIKKLFNLKPKVFRNTELIFNNEIAKKAQDMGYKAILAEGVDRILDWRSPNFIYKVKGASKINILLKNYRLSDDIAFRFSSKEWPEWPLTTEKYASWINQVNGNGETVNLFMDYETFGEHQWQETGILDFLKSLPKEILKNNDNNFKTPSELIKTYKPKDVLDFKETVSWADNERDVSAWLGNSMQQSAIKSLYDLEKKIKKTNNSELIEEWRNLQTSDHFYYMCTKWFNDGDVHKYFNHNETPYEAFINFMNIFNDLKIKQDKNLKISSKQTKLA